MRRCRLASSAVFYLPVQREMVMSLPWIGRQLSGCFSSKQATIFTNIRLILFHTLRYRKLFCRFSFSMMFLRTLSGVVCGSSRESVVPCFLHISTMFRISGPTAGWLGGGVVSVLDSGAERPGFKSQPRRYRVTAIGKLFIPIVTLFTKQRNWQQPS